MRAVLDVNVLVSGVLSASGAPADILRAVDDGQFELVISEMLISELRRTLGYQKLRTRVPPERAAAFLGWVGDHGTMADDPSSAPPVNSRDPGDDYLVALAIDRRAYLVTGDQDLLVLGEDLPIVTPAQFATQLRENC